MNGLHSSTNTPPNIPIITGEPAVKKRKIVQPKRDESFTDILKSAVSVFAERFAPNPPLATGVSTSTMLGVSPASKAKLSYVSIPWPTNCVAGSARERSIVW